MSTQIRVWQIQAGKLEELDTSMAEAGRNEPNDLQAWIKSEPQILGNDIFIIGEQVQTKAGRMDFLGIDADGNVVVIELKRGSVPREALAQAIDYASDVASWDFERLSAVCEKFREQPLEDYLSDEAEDVDWEETSFNEMQRILLVGAGIDEALQRMIEWLSDNYQVSINAVIFRYVKTRAGEELLVKTVIIPEEVARERTRTRRKLPVSDEPGDYQPDELKAQLRNYFDSDKPTPRRIRKILLPLCLRHESVTRDEVIAELVELGEVAREGRPGTVLSTISKELGGERHDYLRQVVRYDKLGPRLRDNFSIPDEYKDLVCKVLAELEQQDDATES